MKLVILLHITKAKFFPGKGSVIKWSYLIDKLNGIPFVKINYQALSFIVH